MRSWWLIVFLFVGTLVVASVRLGWFGGSHTGPHPLPVPNGDCEIAWLHNPTSYESWENFVWGAKRAEVSEGSPEGLEVDDSAAFPSRTTAVPEIVIRRKGFNGRLRIRWYKVADEATQEAWVSALAARNPAPIAIVGGWSSDRAKELAYAMRDTDWPGPKPLLFLTQATADDVYSGDDRGAGPSLVGIYNRSFRFCFTNKQMAEAVAAFVMSDPTLRPGPIALPELRALASSTAEPWVRIIGTAIEKSLSNTPIPAFSIEWMDDPYSTDLSDKFYSALQGASSSFGLALSINRSKIPFSTGRLNRPTRAEAEAAEYILANLPSPGIRTLLVIPTVSAPARRTLRTLVQGNPSVGRQLVAITGDGIGVNTFFRDREYAWPVRSIPIPVVLFTHADPFAWDSPGKGPAAPPGYELPGPELGGVRSTIEDIQLFARLTTIVATGIFPNGATEVTRSPDALKDKLNNLHPPYFDNDGNRLSGNGEHIVVLRPVIAGEAQPHRAQVDAFLEVYVRQDQGRHWKRIHSRPLGRSTVGGPSE